MTDSAILGGLTRSCTAIGDLLDQIAPDQWAAPTPCTDWNVRQLVEHLVGINLVFVAMLEGSPMPERGIDRLGTDPAGAFRQSAAALQAAAARPGVLDLSQATPLGVATGAERLQWRIADLLTHGWDLVQATGVAADLPDDLVAQALTFVRAHLPDQPRAGRFADPQPVSDDAPALDRLAAFTGRPVPWHVRVRLQDIARVEDRAAVMHLQLGPGQDRYLDSIADIFAEADEEQRAKPHPWAVHDAGSGAVVGFVMISDNIPEPMDPDLVGPYYLWKLFIDAPFQGRGYGAATLDALQVYLRSRPGADVLYTSCADGPGSPRGFYLRYGFTDTGRVMWGENVLALVLSSGLSDNP